MTDTVSWSGRSLWLAALVILLPLLALVGMQHWTEDRGDLELGCTAQLADGEGPLSENLALHLSIHDGNAELVYGVHRDGVELGAIRLWGTLSEWTPASLSYHLSLDKGQVLMDFTQPRLPDHLQQVVMLGRQPLVQGKPLPVSFRVLELEKHSALVVFDDSQALWSCEVKKWGPMAR
ncbi:hypothetical protein KJI95_03390 [Shewanella sp. JM162201]|uniref:Uncharacterized protein n=1 Tax=Shewanella jiangmenensis TaxID=2837387 RepID=A0ABS5UZG8_9GAMM|nr:hypothetical protein [Shewanella jiangmenensis]MBT1443565.1 hypothetical protein [Shewanella jiangmenensis]